jgi:hypothetical protein
MERTRVLNLLAKARLLTADEAAEASDADGSAKRSRHLGDDIGTTDLNSYHDGGRCVMGCRDGLPRWDAGPVASAGSPPITLATISRPGLQRVALLSVTLVSSDDG